MFFPFVISFVIVQRFVELRIAKRNERHLAQLGAVEYGKAHYKWMVFMHVCFFIVLLAEVIFFQRELIRFWPIYFIIFVMLQLARIWVIRSLGKYWNTKIIILPGSDVITAGPYKYVKHPNYIIVTLELLVIPLMFQAYFTASLFFILNQVMLAIRIPIEERALRTHTNYLKN